MSSGGSFGELFGELRILVRDTIGVFWRRMPEILSIYLLGWLGSQLAMVAAVALVPINAWVAIAVFAFNFLSRLVAIVLILRIVGRELGLWSLIPADEQESDGRDQSLTQLLAVTLLPFLALYAAFGEVQQAASQMSVQEILRHGYGADSTLSVLSDAANNHPWWLLLGLVGVYLVRRGVDALHDRTGFRPLGLLVALIESFFMLVVILGGIRLWQQVMIWWRDRAVVGWIDTAREAVLGALRAVWTQLPDLVVQAFALLAEQVWPLFWEVLSQPIIWLAVAALVYGSRVLSLAELWRRGQPVAAQLPGATVFSRYRDKLAVRRPQPPAGLRRAGSEFRQAFLGDIDDKYLPTIHSVRLILRAGLTFLTAYVVVYSGITILRNYQEKLVDLVIGGHEVDFWYLWQAVTDLAYDLPFEPLRLCLLAVAFRRCLQLFRSRAGLDPVTAEHDTDVLRGTVPSEVRG